MWQSSHVEKFCKNKHALKYIVVELTKKPNRMGKRTKKPGYPGEKNATR